MIEQARGVPRSCFVALLLPLMAACSQKFGDAFRTRTSTSSNARAGATAMQAGWQPILNRDGVLLTLWFAVRTGTPPMVVDAAFVSLETYE